VALLDALSGGRGNCGRTRSKTQRADKVVTDLLVSTLRISDPGCARMFLRHSPPHGFFLSDNAGEPAPGTRPMSPGASDDRSWRVRDRHHVTLDEGLPAQSARIVSSASIGSGHDGVADELSACVASASPSTVTP
jgi:hypothetical protein